MQVISSFMIRGCNCIYENHFELAILDQSSTKGNLPRIWWGHPIPDHGNKARKNQLSMNLSSLSELSLSILSEPMTRDPYNADCELSHSMSFPHERIKQHWAGHARRVSRT